MEPTNNQRTVESYELIADDYSRNTESDHPVLSSGLAQLAESVPGGDVLEIGSGPGWDADFLEKAGLEVRRSDVTQGFIDFQRGRGRKIDRLDAINDDLGGPYDAVVCLHVLQHMDARELGIVPAKVAGALRPGGHFLVSIPVGEGEGWEEGESGRPYYRALRTEHQFVAALADAGLHPTWIDRSEHADGWICILAIRR